LFFISCSITRNNTTEHVVGEYKCIVDYRNNYFIKLKSDNTFEYDWLSGFWSGITHGTWYLKGRKIILNSDRQLKLGEEEKYKILKIDTTFSDSKQ
jgi:hypothetical protein